MLLRVPSRAELMFWDAIWLVRECYSELGARAGAHMVTCCLANFRTLTVVQTAGSSECLARWSLSPALHAEHNAALEAHLSTRVALPAVLPTRRRWVVDFLPPPGSEHPARIR